MDSSKILVLTPDLALDGGVTNYYRALNLSENPAIDYFYVNSPSKSGRLKKILKVPLFFLHFILKAPRYNLIHVNPSLDLNSFYRDMVFIALSLIFRKQVLIFFRGWQDTFQQKIQNSKLLNWLFLQTYAKADTFIVLGECFKSRLLSLGVAPDKPFFIETTVADSEGVDELDLHSKNKSANEMFECLYISRVLRDKGIYIALDAYATTCRKHPNVPLSFTVAGTGPDLDGAKKYVAENSITNVKFVGEVRGLEKGRLLANSHVLLFPSYYGEGLPNCVLEGMLFGMCILSRNNAAIPEVVQHKLNGLLTDSTDSEVFAKFLSQIVTDPSILQDMGQVNHTTALERFTTEQVRKRLLEIYRTLLPQNTLVA